MFCKLEFLEVSGLQRKLLCEKIDFLTEDSDIGENFDYHRILAFLKNQQKQKRDFGFH